METKTEQRKRIIIAYLPYGAREERYSAASLTGIAGDRVFLRTIFGEQAFDRRDGRWIEGPCLNFADGRIHQFEDFELAIQEGRSAEYENTATEDIPVDGAGRHQPAALPPQHLRA